MTNKRRCAYCMGLFEPSPFHAKQLVCSSQACQLQRRRESHRKRYCSDPVYRQVCLESTQKWRQLNPEYQRDYRQNHPEYVRQNREAQRGRDAKLHVAHLVKNNSAIDLKSLPARAWLVGPELEDLVKNNLAISQVMIFQTVAGNHVHSPGSCKEHLSGTAY